MPADLYAENFVTERLFLLQYHVELLGRFRREQGQQAAAFEQIGRQVGCVDKALRGRAEAAMGIDAPEPIRRVRLEIVEQHAHCFLGLGQCCGAEMAANKIRVAVGRKALERHHAAGEEQHGAG